MNFTYDPQEFAINMDMFMNEMSVYSNSVSGKTLKILYYNNELTNLQS